MPVSYIPTRGYGEYSTLPAAQNLAEFDATSIITMACENAGYDAQQLHAGHIMSAIRLLNTILLEWSNLRLVPWAMAQRQVVTKAGDYTYELDADIVDIAPGASITDQTSTDLPLQHMSREDFEAIPDKLLENIPSSMWLWRKEPPILYLYPTPDAVYTINLWVVRKLTGVTRMAEGVDISSRWVNAIRRRLALEVFDSMPAERRMELYQLRPDLQESAVQAFAALHHGHIEESSWFTR